jgi:hypothetical protein
VGGDASGGWGMVEAVAIERSGAAEPAASAPSTRVFGRILYKAGGGRATTFSFIFLLLLPFFVSLGPMLAMRISHGLWDGTLGLAILAAAFAVLMFLIVAELLYSIRARVDLGERSLRATLPAGRGPTPLLRYARHDIPYDRIAAVETRCEVYGGAVAPVMLRGVQLLTKDGTAVPLGSVNEACVDPAFPWTEIADEIARRAGVGVLDQGVVRRSVPRKMLGLAASEAERAPVGAETLAALNRRHRVAMLALVAVLTVLVGVGIVNDLTAGESESAAMEASSAPRPKPASRNR